MATINEIVYGYGGEFRRGVWVNVVHSDGGGAYERVLLRNDVPSDRIPDYVRVFYPVNYDGEQSAFEPTFDARGEVFGGLGGPYWATEDDGAEPNSIPLWIADASGNPQNQWIFVEYGVEHSITK